MKVLHYVDENKLAWARPWLQLIRYLETRGVRNHILCRPEGTLGNYVTEQHIGLTTYKPLIAALPQFCLRVSAIIRKFQPDLIHTRLSSAAMIGGYWGKRTGVPVISTIDKYPKRRYYLNSDKLVPCSSAVAAHMRSLGFPASAMELIYNPVGIEEYQRDIIQRSNFRRHHNIAEKDFIILGAGRFVDWKGFDTLLEACLILTNRSLQGRNWKLWLVGDGPERQKLEAYVEAKPNLASKVKFWGYVDDIRPLMWASDLFVLPSHNEPFGLVLLEAMASGLPVISTSVGGPLDIISNESGSFFAPGDVQGLSKIIESLLDFDKLSYYSKAAQKRALDFSVEEIGMQTIDFYERVIHQ